MAQLRMWISLILMLVGVSAQAKVNCDEIHILRALLSQPQIVAQFRVEAPTAQPQILTESKNLFSDLRQISSLEHLGEQRPAPLPETLESFIQDAVADQAGVVLPDFSHLENHREAAKTWDSEIAPKLLQDLLPEGVGYISHQLYGATAPGVVKADATGSFISLRVSIPVQRKDGQTVMVATNVGVSVAALLSNAGKPASERLLVPADAQAVLLSEHGGGTKGTGHHVDIEKQNFFGNFHVPVISVDASFHAEGPTNLVSRAEEEEFLTQLVERYVPRRILDQRRLFFTGHSYGGQKADMLMRRSDDPNFRLGKYLGMIFALSPVADAAPGGSPREKEEALQVRMEKARAEMQDRMTEGDLDLERSLVAAGKLSLSGLMGYLLTSISQNWTVPAHGGANYVPTLMVMGKGDALVYVGFEDLFQKYAFNLKNVIPLVMGARKDFKGQESLTGHIVQDNRKPSEMPPEYKANPKLAQWFERIQPNEVEVYGLMRVAMEDSIGEKLQPTERLTTEQGLFSQIAATWANNRAFRQFAEDFTLYKYQALPRGERLQKEVQFLGQVRKDIEKERKNKAISEADRSEHIATRLKEALAEAKNVDPELDLSTMESLDRAYDKSFSLMTHRWIPEGPMKSIAEENIRLRADFDRQRREAGDRKAELLAVLRGGASKKFKNEDLEHLRALAGKDVMNEKGQVRGLMDIKREVDSQLRTTLSRVTHNGEDARFSPNYLEARRAVDTAFNEAQAQDKITQKLLMDHVFGLQERNELTVENLENPPAPLREAMDRYQKLATQLREKQLLLTQVIESEGLKGSLGADLQVMIQKQTSIRAEVEKVQRQISDLEYVAHKATVAGHRLAKYYVESIVPGNFQVSVTRLMDVLQMDYSQWATYKWILEPAWARWTTLWGERPPPEKIELY